MTPAAAISVASFSTVLAEAFAAVTMTSLQTNLLIGGLRRARAQGRAMAALSSTAPAPPAVGGVAAGAAALSGPAVPPAIGSRDVPGPEVVASLPGAGAQFPVDPAAVSLFQAFLTAAFRDGLENSPLGAAFAAAQNGGAESAGLLRSLGARLGVAVPAAGEIGVEVVRAILGKVGRLLQGTRAVTPDVARLVQAVAAFAIDADEVDLFVAKSARIHAEFEFQASDEFRFRVGQTGEQGGALGALQIVGLAPGFSALYQSTAHNKITLDVEFALANVKL